MGFDSILDRLNDFIDIKSPKLARVLCSTWKDQQSAITYREIRDAILDGHLNMDYLTQWQQDYSQFVTEHYAPMVQNAVEEAAKGLLGAYKGSLIDPQISLMDDYIRENGATLIREISTKQFGAINTLVRQATLTSTMTVDQLARAIRPCIGLTERQTAAANNLYRKLREDGMPHKQALKREISYASKQQRYRAATIAQTEMARAYNAGCDAVVRQNVEAGYAGADSTREWFTAKDERVCPTCGAMHGEKVALDAPFSNGYMTPPGHPCCRCALKYNLVPTKKKPVDTQLQEQQSGKPEQNDEYSADSFVKTGDGDFELTGDVSDMYLADETRAKVDTAISEIRTIDDFKRYLTSKGINLEIGSERLLQLSGTEIPSVKRQIDYSIAAIEQYGDIGGLKRLKCVHFWNPDQSVAGEYVYTAIGEERPFNDGHIYLRNNMDGFQVMHEYSHAWADSTRRRGYDVVTWSAELNERCGNTGSAYFGANADVMEAERFADAIGYAFTRESGDRRFLSRVINEILGLKKSKYRSARMFSAYL